MPSGMVMSWTKARLSVQGGVAVGLEVGMGCGVKVGITGVFPWTRGWVGVAALGGIKGVGVGGGTQAGNRNNAKKMMSRIERGVKRFFEFIFPRENFEGATN